MTRQFISTLITGLLVFTGNAFAQGLFSSGSTGSQGPFPPPALGTSGYNNLTVNLLTGVVTSAQSGATTVTTIGTANLAGSASSGDAFPTG